MLIRTKHVAALEAAAVSQQVVHREFARNIRIEHFKPGKMLRDRRLKSNRDEEQ